MAVSAQVSFSDEHAAAVGRDRIRLLEALARTGSISGAARAVGLTYKAAWDALDAMNNLFGRPLATAHAGGRRGGGAALTEEGLRVVAAFHRLETGLARLLQAMEPDLSGTGISSAALMWGLLMKTSARNALRGVVTGVLDGAVNAEISLAVTPETTLIAVITRDSVAQLGLFPGREATALIKAPFVILARAGDALHTSVRNRLEGVVSRVESGAVNTEVTLDLGAGKTLVAMITCRSAEALGLAVGSPAAALIDAAHIILAVD